MTVIRGFAATDLEAITDLSIRAWTPVFASLHATLGDAVFRRLHPDWRADQTAAVASTCTSGDYEVLVATDPHVVGFVAFAADLQPGMGVVEMIAVDPDRQTGGVGRRLMDAAAERLKAAGMDLLVVETGGDPGHAPARGLYESWGATLLPIARYFRPL